MRNGPTADVHRPAVNAVAMLAFLTSIHTFNMSSVKMPGSYLSEYQQTYTKVCAQWKTLRSANTDWRKENTVLENEHCPS